MKIDPTRLHQISGAERIPGRSIEPVSEVTGAEAARPVAGPDQVALSQRAEEVKAARAALAVVPEVRHERVAELKAQVEAGEYKVDPNKVAERILNPRT